MSRVFLIIRVVLMSVCTLLAFLTSYAFAQSELLRRSVIVTIGRYEAGGIDNLTPELRGLGFSPLSSEDIWRGFPAIRKIEMFYGSAEAGEAGGGDKALASLASRLSDRYPSLAFDPEVRQFVDASKSSGALRFGAMTPQTLTALSPRSHDVVRLISRYLDNGALGGGQGILIDYLGLSEARAYAVLASSGTLSDALALGLSEVAEAEQNEKLERIVRDAKKKYPNLGNEADIRKFELRRAIAKEKPVDAPPAHLGGDPRVMCLCGGIPIGIMPRSQCHVGMPCR